MKDITIKVIEGYGKSYFWLAIFQQNKRLIESRAWWRRSSTAIRNAKKISELLDIPFNDEIIKQHYC